MKIPKSATQAAALLSSSGSSAIGFEAPFQYPVTSAAAVQMYPYDSLKKSGTRYDTANESDHKDILAEIPMMQEKLVQFLLEGLKVHPPGLDYPQAIADALNARLRVIPIESAQAPHHHELDLLNGFVGQNNGVATRATAVFSCGKSLQTEINPNGEVSGRSKYSKLKGSASQEMADSRADSEVTSLDDLDQQIEGQAYFSDGSHLYHHSNVVTFNIYASIGPCDGCKTRIAAFLQNQAEFVASLGLAHAVRLDLNVYYSSFRAEVYRNEEAPTTYGYSQANDLTPDRAQRDLKEDTDGRFFKSFSKTVEPKK
jgi:hypothetical protein